MSYLVHLFSTCVQTGHFSSRVGTGMVPFWSFYFTHHITISWDTHGIGLRRAESPFQVSPSVNLTILFGSKAKLRNKVQCVSRRGAIFATRLILDYWRGLKFRRKKWQLQVKRTLRTKSSCPHMAFINFRTKIWN